VGNSISEGLVLCTDGSTLCAYPNQPAIGWKGASNLLRIRPPWAISSPAEQRLSLCPFRSLFGSANIVLERLGFALQDPTIPQLVSIVNSGNAATITLQSPQGIHKAR